MMLYSCDEDSMAPLEKYFLLRLSFIEMGNY